jgi:DNA-directed RNA polymerase specialized sigma24 family protein
MGDDSHSQASKCFPTTQWTLVLDVIQREDGAAATDALQTFCERYRPAIRNFFLRKGVNPDRAEDYTQMFFTEKILKRWDGRDGFLHMARRIESCRFRGFLSHVLWRFLQDQWGKEKAVTTGGQTVHVSLSDPELHADEIIPGTYEVFGREFDRVFALEVIQKAANLSKHSKFHMAHLRREITQAEAAIELGMKEETFKQAHHRFRERLAGDLWDEVCKLVGPDEYEIRSEIKYLMSLFARSAE